MKSSNERLVASLRKMEIKANGDGDRNVIGRDRKEEIERREEEEQRERELVSE